MQSTGGDVDPDLIFYAPMTQGDLTDAISGASLNIYNNHVYYDSSKGMYYVVKGTPDNYWSTNLLNYMSTSDSYTVVLDCIYPTNSPYNHPMMLTIGGWDNNNTYKPGIARRVEETQGLVKVRKAYIYDGTTSKFYLNGNFIFSEAAPNLAHPSNWNSSNLCNRRITLGGLRNSADLGNFWCNNARIYKRALSPYEIMSIPEVSDYALYYNNLVLDGTNWINTGLHPFASGRDFEIQVTFTPNYSNNTGYSQALVVCCRTEYGGARMSGFRALYDSSSKRRYYVSTGYGQDYGLVTASKTTTYSMQYINGVANVYLNGSLLVSNTLNVSDDLSLKIGIGNYEDNPIHEQDARHWKGTIQHFHLRYLN